VAGFWATGAAQTDSHSDSEVSDREIVLMLNAFVTKLGPVALEAGLDAMRYYGSTRTAWKGDAGPIARAAAVILPALRALTPGIPIVAGEETGASIDPALAAKRFWLVDPLDGIDEFTTMNGEFTINIALIDAGLPVLGIVHSPVTGDTYSSAGAGTTTWTPAGGTAELIAVRIPPGPALTPAERRSTASSLKLCRIARGVADIYMGLDPTREWTIAAGHAVLRGAGGRVETVGGKSIDYGKPEFRNPPFVAYGNCGFIC
jgi:3'(2'), 5'-bisphosphate nucleotidase